MRRFCILFFALALCSVMNVSAQRPDFPTVSIHDVTMTRYGGDTAASAVVLREFGEAMIKNGDDYNLIFKYRVRIKILKKEGLRQANIEIPLYKQDDRKFERLLDLQAFTYNLEEGEIREYALDSRHVFRENRTKYLDVRKLAMPNVRVGSVIDIAYTMETPFIFNFRTWEFQSDLPKMESEFWARIPGVYRYNITLRGYLPLTKNETTIEKDCLGTATGPMSGGFSADCALMKFRMDNIPAFVEEEYMTATKNFLAAIHFELAEIRYPDGRVDRVTREWKDAEHELRQDNRFGVQLKRGKEIGEEVRKLVAEEGDEYSKAIQVYNYIRESFLWNDTFGKYSEYGIRKAFDEKRGNVGDINLALIAAMRFAGLDAEPVILSTRENGMVIELHPVLSQFNYVVAKVNMGDKFYLADATEKFLPFGFLPERCLNGKGRVIGERDSYWIDLTPADSRRTSSILSLTLGPDGTMRGTMRTTFTGYDAIDTREEIAGHPTVDDYVSDLQAGLPGIVIKQFEIANLDVLDKPVTRKLEVEMAAFDDLESDHFLFNPFMLDRWKKNPFKSAERFYPVDFGVPLERAVTLVLEFPDNLELVAIPEKVALGLPNNGGRFLLDARVSENKLSLTHILQFRKPSYSSTEYYYLRELFNRILQVQNTDLVFRKKP